MSTSIYTYIITSEHNNTSLKQYLTQVLKLSTRLISRLKNKDGISINDEIVTVRYVLATNDTLRLTLIDNTGNAIKRKCDGSLDVLFADEYIIVINKPPFMAVHPSIAHFDNTLSNFVAYAFNIDCVRISTRLDHNTSGIVLIAKDALTSEKLNQQLIDGTVIKQYVAVVEGNVSTGGTIDAPIARDSSSNITRCVNDSGQHAVTHFQPIKQLGDMTLVSIRLETGRTHQIRVHLSFIKHPIVGDDLYGNVSSLINRQALHMSQLTFTHPHTGNLISLTAPLPQDMQSLINNANDD